MAGGFGSRYHGTSTTRSTGGGFGSRAQAPAKKSEHRGILDEIGHVVGQTGADLYHAAVNTPAGVYYLGKGLATDPIGTVKQVAKSTYEDVRHPLRHPGYTLLDVLGILSAGAGTAARVGAVGGKLAEGAKAGELARAALTKPHPGPRVHKVGDLKVQSDYSRAPLARGVQKGTDALLAKGHAKNPTGRLGKAHEKRVSKALQLNVRLEAAAAQGPAAALRAMGRKLKPHEQEALRVVANEAPILDRIAVTKQRIAASSGAELRRHEAKLANLEKAQALVTEGKPALKPHLTKLNHVFGRMAAVAKNREELLKQIDSISEEGIRQHKTDVGRVALGAVMETQKEATKARGVRPKRARVEQFRDYPGRSKTVMREMTDAEARDRLAVLDKKHAKLLEKMIPEISQYDAAAMKFETSARNKSRGKVRKGRAEERTNSGSANIPTVLQELRDAAEAKLVEFIGRHPDHPVAIGHAQRLAERDKLREILNSRSGLEDNPLNLPTVSEMVPGKPRRVHLREQKASKGVRATPEFRGAEHFTASPDAVYVPEKVTRRGSKSLSRQPVLGGQGTIGKAKAPASLTAGYTGKAAQHALERQDTTALVAEANLEAQKYAGAIHLRDMIKGATHAVPQSNDDVFVRYGMKAHEATPLAIRRFIDDPGEAFVPVENRQQHFADFLKETFVRPRDMTPADRAAFEKLAADGKGGWVSKTILGDWAKPQAPLSSVLGKKTVGTVDAINNASRFAILYLKPAYLAPNLLGNVTLNLIQQGPVHLAMTLRKTSTLSFKYPELAARIDALMGEGIARSVTGDNGALNAVVQGGANAWSKVVDVAFRRSAFVFEARRAGFKTPADIERLLTNSAHHDELLGVSRRANREIIDYGRLGSREREIVRRVVFFYPWVKGSTMYAGHLAVEHPVTTAGLGQVGKTGREKTQEALGPVPSYLEGIFPVGKDRVVNPASAAILQTPAQVGAALAGLATGDVSKVAELSNFLTPAASLAASEVFRRSPSGYGYPGGTSGAAIAKDVLSSRLPQAVLLQRIQDARHGKGQGRLYPPNVLDALLQYGVGGLAPRKYNHDVLSRLYASEQTQIKSGR